MSKILTWDSKIEAIDFIINIYTPFDKDIYNSIIKFIPKPIYISINHFSMGDFGVLQQDIKTKWISSVVYIPCMYHNVKPTIYKENYY